MKRFFTLLLGAFGSVLAEKGAAQTTTASWNFTSNTSASSTATYYTASAVSVANGFGTVTTLNNSNPSSGYTGASGGNSAVVAAKSGSFNTATSTYYEFTLTPGSGNTITLNSLSVGTWLNSDGPGLISVRASIDNYATEYAALPALTNSIWFLGNASGLNITGGTGAAVTIRIYGYGSSGTPVSGAVNWVIDDLSVDADVSGPNLPACSAPTAVSNLSATASSSSNVGVSFTAASNANGYVVFRSGSSTLPTLSNGTTYNSGNAPSGFTFVGSGSGTVYSASGLSGSTTYYFHAFSYKSTNCTGGPTYSTGSTTSATTQAPPACSAPTFAYSGMASNITTNSVTFYVSLVGSANGYLAIRYTGSQPSQPVNGVVYNSANISTLGTGLTFVYSGPGQSNSGANAVSETGLAPASQYKYAVWSINSGSNGSCTGPTYATTAYTPSFVTPGMQEQLIPKYMTSKTGAAANTAQTYFPVLVKLGGLTPNTLYNAKLGLAPTAEAATSYGGGLFAPMNVNATFSGQVINSAFTTNAAGIGSLLAVAQTGADAGRFGAGQAHQLRIGVWAASGGSQPGSPQYTSTATITSLDIAPTALTGTTADDGAFFLGSSTAGNAHGFTALWDNVDGTGQPLSTALVLSNTPNQGSQAGLPASVDAVYAATPGYSEGDFAAVFPAAGLSPLGVKKIVFYGSSSVDTSVLASVITQPTGIWAGINTTTAGWRDVLATNVYAAPYILVINNNVNLPGNVVVNTLQLGSSGSLTLGANNLTISNGFAANGATINASGSGTLTFSGATPLTLPAGLFTSNAVSKLTLSNTGGVTLGGPVAVTNTLTLNGSIVNTGSNVLTIGSVSTPGTLSFTSGGVKGTLERYFSGTNSGAGSGLFPMLNGNSQQRFATVDFSGAPTTGGKLTATVSESGAGSLPAGTLTVPAVGACPSFNVNSLGTQFITLSRTAGGGTMSNDGIYDVTLAIQGPLNTSDPCKLTILKRPDAAGSWALAGTQTPPVQNGQVYTLKRTGITGFSDFGLGGGSTPLGAGLLSFALKQEGATGAFAWELAAGNTLVVQDLQESEDGRTFETIHTTSSTGGPQSWRYSLPGQRWYRLRLVDAEGSIAFSSVLRSAGHTGGGGAVLQPNPATDGVTVKAAGLREVRLYNAVGALLQTVTAGAGTDIALDLRGLPPGRYIVQVVADVPAVLPLLVR